MARPLVNSDTFRESSSGNWSGRQAFGGNYQPDVQADSGTLSHDELHELQQLRAENGQLHQLCVELEQALHEAAHHVGGPDLESKAKEWETLLEERAQTIADLHRQIEEAKSCAQESQGQNEPQARDDAPGNRTTQGPVPREEELLALSEELERERRQLQEDEQALMEQMRGMEVAMARERAEMARQRNDLQRLQEEIRHDIERLERCGGLHSKIDNFRSRFQDASTRRGAAPSSANATPQAPSVSQPTPLPQSKGSTSFMGRLFGR